MTLLQTINVHLEFVQYVLSVGDLYLTQPRAKELFQVLILGFHEPKAAAADASSFPTSRLASAPAAARATATSPSSLSSSSSTLVHETEFIQNLGFDWFRHSVNDLEAKTRQEIFADFLRLDPSMLTNKGARRSPLLSSLLHRVQCIHIRVALACTHLPPTVIYPYLTYLFAGYLCFKTYLEKLNSEDPNRALKAVSAVVGLSQGSSSYYSGARTAGSSSSSYSYAGSHQLLHWNYCVDIYELLGLDFLWRIFLDNPRPAIARQSCELLLAIYYFALASKHKKARFHFHVHFHFQSFTFTFASNPM